MSTPVKSRALNGKPCKNLLKSASPMFVRKQTKNNLDQSVAVTITAFRDHLKQQYPDIRLEESDCFNDAELTKAIEWGDRKVFKQEEKKATKKSSAPPAKAKLEPIPIQPTAEREQQWQTIKHHLLTNFLRPDIEAGRVLLATVASHRLAAYPPSWAMAIAPPGSLKTELLEALDGLPDVHLIDEFTANTFISGKLQDDPHEERKVPASLLHRIGDTGIIIIPDLSTITEIDPKVRGKILSQLRRVYDGHLRREFGSDENMEEREWKGRITVLAGATPDVDRHQKVFAGLGDRFIRIRWPRAGGS